MIKSILNNMYQAAVNTIDHDGIEHAGYMAFLCLLAIFPFLVFIVAFTGFIGASQLGTEILQFFLNNLPENISQPLEPRIKEIISGPPQGLLTLAIVGAIWTASSAVEGLRTILNRVYRVVSPPPYIWRRLLSILQFILLAGVICITMLLLVVLPIIWDKFIYNILTGTKLTFFLEWIKALNPIWSLIRYTIVLSILVMVVSWLYYMLPNIKLSWQFIFPGAVIVVILWFLGGTMLTFYLSHFKQVSIIYGSLGGIIITLLFFYIINMIFIYGAEFNYLFGNLIITNKYQPDFK